MLSEPTVKLGTLYCSTVLAKCRLTVSRRKTDELQKLQLLFTLSNVFSLVRPFTVSVSVKSIKYFCILFCYMPIAPGKDVDVFSRARALRWWRARNVACFLSWLAGHGRSEVQKSLTHPGVTH